MLLLNALELLLGLFELLLLFEQALLRGDGLACFVLGFRVQGSGFGSGFGSRRCCVEMV